MKTTLLLLFTIFFYCRLFAQTNNYPPSGNVGLGTGTPKSKLDVVADAKSGFEEILRLRVTDAPNDYLMFSNATSSASTFIPGIWGKYTADQRPAIFFGGEIISDNDSGSSPVVVFDARSSGTFLSHRNAFLWRNYTNELMVLSPTGNLGIGTNTPGHKLDVLGTVRAMEVKVDMLGADFVFEVDYSLMPLAELDAFIKVNGHLPEIDSAEEMEAEGVELGELNSKLLQKIEELTLYLIKQDEQINELRAKNKELETLTEKLFRIEQRLKKIEFTD